MIDRSRFHLRYEAVQADTGVLTLFRSSLESADGSDVDLAGISGVLVDMSAMRAGSLCITIHDALIRHTPPKRADIQTGRAARAQFVAGVDAHINVATRYALLLWCPEIYNESIRGGGTRFIADLRRYLSAKDISALLDFGLVEPEDQDFVRYFFPQLGLADLEVDGDLRFARGRWAGDVSETYPSRKVGFVYL